MKIAEFRRNIDKLGKIEAVKLISPSCASMHQADVFIYTQIMQCLALNKKLEAALLLWGMATFNPLPHCVQRVWAAIEGHAKVLIQGGGAVGKCLGRGVKVLMFDGTTKNAEDVETGDMLMGDDSKPRYVMGVSSGYGKLYKIVPSKGDPWICNSNHILSLKSTYDKKNGDGKTNSSTYAKGKIIDIPIEDAIEKSRTFFEYFKQFASPVVFDPQPVDFDPYIYGLWIGDGGTGHPVLHNADSEIINTWCEYFESLGYYIYIGGENYGPCRAYYARTGGGKHPFKDFIRASVVNGMKRIRREYMVNSNEVRLKLLAGIIDTDGTNAGSGYVVTTKIKGLAKDIQFVARGLGFYSTVNPITKTIKSIGFSGEYFNVYIGGDCRKIPTKIKKCDKPSGRDALATSIRIMDAGEGEYFGFSVDGNHRFLLGDFTVTHNSYTGAAWILLDWWSDPEYTSVHMISTTGKHAQKNIFSSLQRLFSQAIVKMPGVASAEYIGLDPKEKKSGIGMIAIPEGSDGKGRLQGFHAEPRPIPHPRFGPSARGRVFFDEGEEVPIGGWEGVKNYLMSIKGPDRLKVIAAYNPKDQSSYVAKLCEPIEGNEVIDAESGVDGKNEWTSREGWHVIRIDPKYTENVMAKEEVHPGLVTYEGYMDRVNENGGNSPEYWTFGRGLYPPQGVNNIIIPSGHIKMARGEFVFSGNPIQTGGIDTAVDGRDLCIFTKSRVGMATGFLPKGSGKPIKFIEPRLVMQVDQQFECRKGDVKIVGDDIIQNAVALGITPEYLGIDSTGNGGAVWAYVCAQWGQIHGVCFSDAATNIKILEQDKRTPEEQYDGLVTEVWYALRYWMEFGYVALSPNLKMDPLESQLIGRRYKLSAGQLVRVEKKEDFQKRLGSSPDFADSLTVNLHAVRVRESIMGSMTGKKRKEDPTPDRGPIHGFIDRRKWVDFGA